MQNNLYTDIQGFFILEIAFSAFSIFYDCRLVGAGCRQVHVARRSRWLVFDEGAAGSRQAGWGGGADIRYCQLSAGNPSLLPGTSMLSKVD